MHPTQTEQHMIAYVDPQILEHNAARSKNPFLWEGLWWMFLRRMIEKAGRSVILEETGMKKQYLSNALKEETDIRMSSIVRIALAAGMIPHLVLEPILQYARRRALGMPLMVRIDGEVDENVNSMTAEFQGRRASIQFDVETDTVLLTGTSSFMSTLSLSTANAKFITIKSEAQHA